MVTLNDINHVIKDIIISQFGYNEVYKIENNCIYTRLIKKEQCSKDAKYFMYTLSLNYKEYNEFIKNKPLSLLNKLI